MKIANREKALTALLESASITDAAKSCGLSEKTLRRYLEDKDFQAEYRNARRMIFEQNIVRLPSLHAGAVDTLERNLTCENPSKWIKHIAKVFYKSWKISKNWLIVVKNSLAQVADYQLLKLLNST